MRIKTFFTYSVSSFAQDVLVGPPAGATTSSPTAPSRGPQPTGNTYAVPDRSRNHWRWLAGFRDFGLYAATTAEETMTSWDPTSFRRST